MFIVLVMQLLSFGSIYCLQNVDSVSLTSLQSLAEETVLLMHLLSNSAKDITQFLKLTCTKILPFLLTHTYGW